MYEEGGNALLDRIILSTSFSGLSRESNPVADVIDGLDPRHRGEDDVSSVG
jgi:hypothetical protein